MKNFVKTVIGKKDDKGKDKNAEQNKDNGIKNDKKKIIKSEISDVESTNSTIAKMNDFLNEYGVVSNTLESSTSASDELTPMVSASFPLNYEEMEKLYKTKVSKDNVKQKAKDDIPIKAVLEEKRSEIEEIRLHLEKRNKEMQSRLKTIGGPKKETKIDLLKPDVLSYHSTEFASDLDLTPYKGKSLTNEERLVILKNKLSMQEQEKKEQENKKDPKKQVDYCHFSTHAIHTHLLKLKNIAKSKCRIDSKIDQDDQDVVKQNKKNESPTVHQFRKSKSILDQEKKTNSPAVIHRIKGTESPSVTQDRRDSLALDYGKKIKSSSQVARERRGSLGLDQEKKIKSSSQVARERRGSIGLDQEKKIKSSSQIARERRGSLGLDQEKKIKSSSQVAREKRGSLGLDQEKKIKSSSQVAREKRGSLGLDQEKKIKSSSVVTQDRKRNLVSNDHDKKNDVKINADEKSNENQVVTNDLGLDRKTNSDPGLQLSSISSEDFFSKE